MAQMGEAGGGAGTGAGGGGGESVRVIVRLRPEEQEGGALAGGKDMAGCCIQCVDDKKLTVVDPRRRRSSGGGSGTCRRSSGGGSGISTAGGGGKRGEDQHQHQQAHDFTFDRVFGPEATQDDVFDTVKPLVHATVDGKTGHVAESCLGQERARGAGAGGVLFFGSFSDIPAGKPL